MTLQQTLDVDGLLFDPGTRTIVCCGSGGVGKTTVAAALALRAAEGGRKVVVLTIDPARRLAQSMGLHQLDNTPRPVQGVEGSGSLDAMMLDMKRTFDELVESHSDPERARSVLENPFYQTLSTSFAGTQEYMAMEKLGQLRQDADAEGTWDLIVVDTPPSRSALDFLDAPNRLGSFLDGRFIRILSAPTRGAGKGLGRIIGTSFGFVSGTLGKVLGTQLLNDLAGFVQALESIFGGFRARADATYQLLKEPGTAFAVIAVPEPDAIREATYFVDRLATESMPMAGMVLNRVTVPPTDSISAAEAVAGAEHLVVKNEHALTAALLLMHSATLQTGERQRHIAQRFEAAHPRVPIAIIPALPDDVHDLDGLRRIGELLIANQ